MKIKDLVIQKGAVAILKGKCKLYELRYKETKEIFGKKALAPELYSCMYGNYVTDYELKEYSYYLHDTEVNYQEILKNMYNIINEIYEKPTIEDIFYTYCYIVRNGYLSIDGKYIFLYPEHEIMVRKGLSIMTGISVCRNLADMLVDLLYYFNYYSISIMTDRISKDSEEEELFKGFYDIKNSNDPIDDINFNDQFNEKMENSEDFSYGNHVEVITFLEDKTLVLDPTAICIYDVTDKGEYSMTDYFKPWSLYVEGKCDIKNTCILYKSIKNKKINIQKGKEIIDIQRNIFNTCEDSKDKILGLRKKVLPNIIYIDKSLKEREA